MKSRAPKIIQKEKGKKKQNLDFSYRRTAIRTMKNFYQKEFDSYKKSWEKKFWNKKWNKKMDHRSSETLKPYLEEFMDHFFPKLLESR